jgi:hypothetical protein
VAQSCSNDLPFFAVFPDTNIFLPRWPDEAAGLAALVSNAGLFKIPIYLLEAVEIELEAHQLREAKATIQKISKLAQSLPPVGSPAVEIESPDWEKVRSELRAKAAVTKAALGLRSCSFSPLTLQDLFNMAVNHELPFGEDGKHFQDAVILRSVIDTSRLEGLSTVAFVSKNYRDFDVTALADRARKDGITLRIYTSLEAVRDALWPHVQELIRTAWRKDNDLAEAAIYTVNHELEEFLREQFVHTSGVTLELLRVSAVETAYLNHVTKEQSPTAIRFVADVKFVTTIMSDVSGDIERKSLDIERGIAVEGWATFSNGGYRGVQFESAVLTR